MEFNFAYIWLGDKTYLIVFSIALVISNILPLGSINKLWKKLPIKYSMH